MFKNILFIIVTIMKTISKITRWKKKADIATVIKEKNDKKTDTLINDLVNNDNDGV